MKRNTAQMAGHISALSTIPHTTKTASNAKAEANRLGGVKPPNPNRGTEREQTR